MLSARTPRDVEVSKANPPVLLLKGVSKIIAMPPPTRPLSILSGVDLTVRRGEHISIQGRSGSGKSTLLNIMGLLDEPSAGVLVFNGVPTASLTPGSLAKLRGGGIGFIFQQFNLLEGRSVLENVMLPLLYSGGRTFWRRKLIALEMLEAVGLAGRADSSTTRLSGGEQQRVAVARAIAKRPQLILADEPTGALDVETGTTVMSTLIEVARQCDAALVTITHDTHVAEQADKQYFLQNGSIHSIRDEQAGRL